MKFLFTLGAFAPGACAARFSPPIAPVRDVITTGASIPRPRCRWHRNAGTGRLEMRWSTHACNDPVTR